MSLSRIQSDLADLYDVPLGECVDDFVCDAEAVERAAGDAHARGEVLLVVEDDEGVAVGLYVHPDALAALAEEGEDAWAGDRFGAQCLATEGVSHFVYLMFRAGNEDAVSELELELQAEVDKYATALLAGNGAGAIRARSRQVRRRLFHGVRFLDAADTEQGARYRMAHRLAARYSKRLEASYLARGDLRGLLAELRRFYRYGLREKLEHARR